MMMRPGHGVALLTGALLVFGVVMVNSAGLLVGERVPRVSHESVFLGAPMFHALLAVVALAIGAMVPLRRIDRLRPIASPAPWALLGALILLFLVWAPATGITMNSSNRWLDVGGIRFQASEVAKWVLPFFLAWFLTREAVRIERPLRGLLPALGIIGVVTVLIAIEDLGTAFLVACVAFVLLIGAGARLAHLAALAPIAGLALVAGVMAEPYRVRRLVTFLDPWSDPQGSGWHIIQSLRAISGGGIAGRGLGAGEQKFDLTSDTTDFIFSIVCEELGIIGASLVIAAFVGLLGCGLAIIADRRRLDSDQQIDRWEPFVRLLGLGILLTVGFQALFNILVTTAMIPTKGIALPLISRGGTGWILTAFCMGMLIAIERAHRSGASGSKGSAAPEAASGAGQT